MDVVLVVSNKKTALGVLKAKMTGIPYVIFEKEDSWSDLIMLLKNLKIDFIFLLGFMKILPQEFIDAYPRRIFNIHPSLLPDYPGLKSIERAYNDNSDTGVTIHQVTAGVDEGPILIQRKVRRQQSLSATEMHVHINEHLLLREVFGG